MKNLLPFFLAILIMASCRNGNNDEARNIQLLTDSTVYTNNNVYSDTIAGVQTDQETIQNEDMAGTASKPAKQKVIVKYVPVKTVIIEKQSTPSAIPPVATPPVVNNSGSAGSETVNTGNEIPDAGTPGEVKPEKKGWSKAAQGAVIGGVAGAVGGAIISKKKGLGAVIGGVVGAAGGYIIGKNKDKKDAAKN